jgi:hypothetical protein
MVRLPAVPPNSLGYGMVAERDEPLAVARTSILCSLYSEQRGAGHEKARRCGTVRAFRRLPYAHQDRPALPEPFAQQVLRRRRVSIEDIEMTVA